MMLVNTTGHSKVPDKKLLSYIFPIAFYIHLGMGFVLLPSGKLQFTIFLLLFFGFLV